METSSFDESEESKKIENSDGDDEDKFQNKVDSLEEELNESFGSKVMISFKEEYKKEKQQKYYKEKIKKSKNSSVNKNSLTNQDYSFYYENSVWD